ncbi:MAG: DUF1844 domain-containing protein [Deltaproteobacteria bacterium]|nr:DUF1844 domain-containing protein [Deltaproteobacteria bacterium]MBW2067954.1 DUF1844 domain-containing protein [Deltaproteobacteria bacterium]
MEEKEEKGFVFRDRRKVRLDELDKDDVEAQQPTIDEVEERKAKEEYTTSSAQHREKTSDQLPKVTFSTFIFSLASSALVHLGEVSDPVTNQKSVNLTMARQIIDTLAVIEEKTQGNLSKDEEQLLKSLLYDLRMKFVQKSSQI